MPTALAWIQSCAMYPGYSVLPVTQSATMLGPPRSGETKMPVSNAPRMPPTAWTPNTSSVSSTFSRCFRPLTPHRQTRPAAMPITNAPGMPTLPAAGVMATSPATAPDAAPSIDGLPLNIHSPNVHDNTAQAVARYVLMNASAAEPLASSADPALKPNQPNHSSDAPIMVIGRFAGAIDSLPKPMRLPI